MLPAGMAYNPSMPKSLRIGNLSLAVLIASVAFCGNSMFAAQSPAPPPDFAADAATSRLPVGDDYLPPVSGPGPVTFDPAHPYIPNFTGKQPTYRVADLTNPILQPWVAEQMHKANEAVLAGHVPFRARESCWPPGVPTFLVYALATPLYFLQTRNKVAIFYQGGPELRHIYLNVPHSTHPAPSWYGESIGHYEGDALVIDTIGFNERTFVDNYRTPHTSQLHVVERYRLTDGGNMLEVTFQVEDPGAFTTSWSAIQRFRRVHRAPMAELPCVETNVRYFNYDTYPVPTADKPDF
jgi:hypothetical protein